MKLEKSRIKIHYQTYTISSPLLLKPSVYSQFIKPPFMIHASHDHTFTHSHNLHSHTHTHHLNETICLGPSASYIFLNPARAARPPQIYFRPLTQFRGPRRLTPFLRHSLISLAPARRKKKTNREKANDPSS